jgi:hypothetical protein
LPVSQLCASGAAFSPAKYTPRIIHVIFRESSCIEKVHNSWAVFASFAICFASSITSAIIVKTTDSTYRMIVICSIMHGALRLRAIFEEDVRLEHEFINHDDRKDGDREREETLSN